jgi:hypothetical protein
MKKLKTVRVIAPVSDKIYVDKTVIGFSRGELKKPFILKEIIHGYYREIGVLSGEAIQDGESRPKHDKVFCDPCDFMFHYLRRIK